MNSVKRESTISFSNVNSAIEEYLKRLNLIGDKETVVLGAPNELLQHYTLIIKAEEPEVSLTIYNVKT